MTKNRKPTEKARPNSVRKGTVNSATPARTDAETRLWNVLTCRPRPTAQLAEDAEIGRSTASKALTRWAAAEGHVTRASTDEVTGPRAAHTWALPRPTERTTEPATTPTTTTRPRLRPGELRVAVAAYLAAPELHGQSHTPGQVARALDRSAGAVTNALHRLVVDGTATQTSERPRRFTHNRPATTEKARTSERLERRIR